MRQVFLNEKRPELSVLRVRAESEALAASTIFVREVASGRA